MKIFKKNSFQKISIFFLCFSSILVFTNFSFSKNKTKDPLKYKALVLMEAETGKILKEYESSRKLIPASIVKMMLLLLVYEAEKKGTFSFDEKVHVSLDASKIGGSQVYLKEGEIFTLRELVKTVSIASANDSAYAIAEHIAGDEKEMVKLMNERARSLGMQNTKFSSVHGLPPNDSSREEDYTTAFDTAILARELVKFPEVLDFSKRQIDSFRDGKFVLYNTNRKLLKTFKGLDGLKTGYYVKSGFNLCATAKRGKMRLISVVLGSPTKTARNRETKKLLLGGFRVYKKHNLFTKHQPVGETVSVSWGRKNKIKAIVSKSISLVIKRVKLKEFKTQVILPKSLKAPLKKGQKVGEIKVTMNGRLLTSASLIIPEDIPALSWIEWLMSK
ncbi:MAG: D-alanyl-D-alanine carboxypeptidase family protein [Nitrospinota bacterium]|nr:D-alanyl-D-alanine carboxypeptidase family protein [Nitrospinota bacterium]